VELARERPWLVNVLRHWRCLQLQLLQWRRRRLLLLLLLLRLLL
jgi:hypothetical protein